MNTNSNDRFPITSSISIYRLLLTAYPKEFRQEFEEDMLQVFRDCLLRAVEQNRSSGIFGVWAVTLLDLVVSVIEEHLQKETKVMNKNTLIRLSSWAMVLAGIGFFTIFFGYYLSENYPLMHIEDTLYFEISTVYGLLVSPFLFAFGLLGLRARYQQRISPASNSILLLGGLVGPVISLMGMIGTSIDPSLWLLIFYGPSFSMFCLTIFGFLEIRSKPLPRWNFLLILAGITQPVYMLINLILIFELTNPYPIYVIVLLTLQYLSIIAIGLILQGDVQQQEEEGALATA